MREVFEKGNIYRCNIPKKACAGDERFVNLYLGSGKFGACFDAFGLMNTKYANWTEIRSPRVANTVFMHADHWSRGNYGIDFHLPVARILWQDEMSYDVQDYTQNLNIFDGRLTTEYTVKKLFTCKNEQYFNPYVQDIFTMEIQYEGCMPAILLRPETKGCTQYGSVFNGSCKTITIDTTDNQWVGRLQVGTSDICLVLKVVSNYGTLNLEAVDDCIALKFNHEKGKHAILFGVSSYLRKDYTISKVDEIANTKAWTQQCKYDWHKRWGKSWVDVPEDTYQSLWCRSLYYLLSTYAPDNSCIAPPNGWTGNGWSFHFPQDLSFILPSLLRLGHLDIAKAKIEFYSKRLNEVINNTKRIYEKSGSMWPWEFPIGKDFNLFTESVADIKNGEIRDYFFDGTLRYASPNPYQFEIHNAAYVARMAYETALYLNDNRWTKEVALPIVFETAQFYGSAAKKLEDGSWGICVTPSMGQDEAGGFNKKNYLCSLFSAEYSLKIFLEAFSKNVSCYRDEISKYLDIIRNGFAYHKLFDEHLKIYKTYENSQFMGLNIDQKHPIQLNPLTILPMGKCDIPTINAYKLRHKLCPSVKHGTVAGWTLGAFWLAASHMHEKEDLLTELEMMKHVGYIDKEFIQFYESSNLYHFPYYTTTHGLFLQTLNDAVLSDYWGEIEIGSACHDTWSFIRFEKLHAKDGNKYSGSRSNGKWKSKKSTISATCHGKYN